MGTPVKFGGMYRLILISLLIASSSAAALVAQSAAVSITDEPHHKRLLYTNDLRLWDVTLRPGESTQPFVHEYDVASVVIGDGTLALERNGEAFPERARLRRHRRTYGAAHDVSHREQGDDRLPRLRDRKRA